MCRLYISIWYMYIQFIFVLNNQCDMKSKSEPHRSEYIMQLLRVYIVVLFY